MYKIKIFFFGTLVSSSLSAQSNTVSTGGDATGNGGSASYSIGQIDYQNSSGATGNYHQGVQQPFEFYKELSLNEIAQWNTSIFPNPTFESVVIKIDPYPSDLSYQLFDVSGKLLTQGTINGKETAISMTSYSSGSYQLRIIQNNQQIETIKIIKN